MPELIEHSLQSVPNSFVFTEHEIRTAIDEQGEVWFCAKDVFEALGITWKGSKGSLVNCPDKWQMVCYLQTSYGQKETIFISEPAVYQTAFRSNKPEAIRFTEWVCEEVLPTIRKQGFFGTIPATMRLGYSQQIVKLTEKLTETKNQFARAVLESELRDLCNQVGRRMPDVALIGQTIEQGGE